ncbi:MAG: hypothetical protein ABIA63_02560 [bacterium]
MGLLKYQKTGIRGIYRRGKNIIIDITLEGHRIYQKFDDYYPLEGVKKILISETAKVYNKEFLPKEAARSLTITYILESYWKGLFNGMVMD